jgi:hypothetical protein
MVTQFGKNCPPEIIEWLKKYVKVNDPRYLDEGEQVVIEEVCWLDPQGRIKFDTDITNVTITGDLVNFRVDKLPDGMNRIQFAKCSHLFQVRDCPNLVELSGIPDEIYSDTDISALIIQNCKSLKKWDETYCSDGAPHLRISDCDNLHTIVLSPGYDNLVEIFNLKSLDKFVSTADDKVEKLRPFHEYDGLEIYIDNCKMLDPKDIELKTGRIWVENCPKLECEVKGMELDVFNKIKVSKNLQRGKDLGLF